MPLTQAERIARILRRLTLVALDHSDVLGDTPGTRLLIRYAGEAVQKTIELMETIQKRITQKGK